MAAAPIRLWAATGARPSPSWRERPVRWCSARVWRPSAPRPGRWRRPGFDIAWCPPTATIRCAASPERDLAPAGVTVIEASSSQIYDAAAGADVVLAETPTNPTLDVVDLHRLATICHGRGGRLIVDNTAATPLGQQPLSLGADARGGQRHQGAVRPQRPAGRLRRHQRARVARRRGTPTTARRCDPGRVRGLAPVAQPGKRRSAFRAAMPECPGAWRRCWPATRRCGRCATRGWPRTRRIAVAMAQMRRFGALVFIELADAAAVHALVDNSELLIASTSFGGLHTLCGPPGALGRSRRGRIRALSRWAFEKTPTTSSLTIERAPPR